MCPKRNAGWWNYRTNQKKLCQQRFSPIPRGTSTTLVLKVPSETGEGELQAVVNTYPWGSEKTKTQVRISIKAQSPISFLVDTGVMFSCIRKQGMNIPLSKKIPTKGFFRKTQALNFTEPQDLTIEGQSLIAPMLYFKDTPVNLLGRDILCQLRVKIYRPADRTQVEFPDI